MLNLSKLLFISSLLAVSSTQAKETAYVNVNTEIERWQTSKYLTGSHFVYAFENDQLYKDKRISAWMTDSRVGTIRWPGGTAVQYYHWDDLNGIPFDNDSWEPGYNLPKKSPEDFMDVDEYLSYTKRLNIEPMIGINIRSGKHYNRDEDGLLEAKRLIQHVKSNGHKVKFWYIGNEGYAKGFSASKYAEYIDMYAKTLKSVDPDITIIGDWKFGPVRKQRFKDSIDIAKKSEHLDVLEFHEKWGVIWGLETGTTMSKWRNEFPLFDGRLANYINDFHENMELINKPEMKLALNEWGLGDVEGASKFDYGLIASDYLIEIFRNKVFQACYWNLNMGADADHRILNTKNGQLVGLNPIANAFTLFAPAMEKKLLFIESSARHVYGFAVKNPANLDIDLYLINKSNQAVDVKLYFSDAQAYENVIVGKTSYLSPGVLKEGKEITYSSIQKKGVSLSAWSMNRLTISRVKHEQ